VPRNRSARLAVLGAGVPRSRPVGYSSRTASALRRRIVAGLLVLLSIALITVYFRESAHGGLHQAQSVGSTILRPFQVATERVARPFRDAYGYMSDLVGAKSENARLRREVESYRQQLTQNQTAARENTELRALLHYRGAPRFPTDYRSIAATVIVPSSSDFQQEIGIDAGSAEGVQPQSPVVTEDGLVGEVQTVAAHASKVTLLTDEQSAVSVVDPQTGARGIVQHGSGPDVLQVNRVPVAQVVSSGDTFVSSGWRSAGLASVYPPNIPVGRVTFVNQIDIGGGFKQIQIQPFANLSSPSSVLVLVSKRPIPRVP
jgi:rod shape-determining protein MreC